METSCQDGSAFTRESFASHLAGNVEALHLSLDNVTGATAIYIIYIFLLYHIKYNLKYIKVYNFKDL